MKKIVKIFMLILFVSLIIDPCHYAIGVENENGIDVVYEYDSKSNQVTAKIISDIELQDTKPTWKLSNDKKTYTKVFSSNMSYSTPVQDKNGNVINVNINVTQVRVAKITMEYEYNKTTNTVVAKMVSDIELKDTKPTWKLSDDKKVYTKSFEANTNYSTAATDKFGNVINIKINITQVKVAEITMKYEYNEKTNTVVAILFLGLC